jgi:hypothetical protein
VSRKGKPKGPACIASSSSSRSPPPRTPTRFRGYRRRPIRRCSRSTATDSRSAAPHWHLQVTEFAANLYKIATPDGWHARMRSGTFFWVRYYARPDNEGWFVGAALAAIDWRYTRGDTPGAAEQDQFAVMPFAGYRWFPTPSGFYVLPWAGVALPFHTVGDATLGTMTYESKFPVFPLAAVHLGWEFGR